MKQTPWWESDNPDDWPKPLQELTWNSEERKASTSIQRRKWISSLSILSFPISAAAIIAAAFFLFNGKDKYLNTINQSVLITDVYGNVGIRRNGSNDVSVLSPGSKLLAGDLWILSDRSKVQISPSPGISLRLQGPGIVAWKEVISEGIPRLHLNIRSGEVVVLSDPRAAKSLVWESSHQTYVLLGTFARLKVEGNSDSLDVWEGEIQLLSNKTGLGSVREGKSYQVSETDGIYSDSTSSLSYASLREGGIIKTELDQKPIIVTNTQESQSDPDAKPIRTWKELTALYGNAAKIKLKDGTEIIAVWYVKGGKWHLLTPDETRIVAPEFILSLEN
ncbi:hypothetical protein [Leptospira ilyithenensis]|uniref:Uncharacterized protein n=1 Tax=Leptospira ilyithenensis TaxID=2484901 RepID=A0A4R9LLP2_9LEPT|nr:hypothetical protein [Leptospira ilyithenensis]TGN07064.1 hypothetical protein EHS11_18255 [Leptospira ilyithenensis]